jgi:type IV pilus assembly protein PilC
MGQKMLESSAISTFCDSIAAMISAGIQVDEALSILSENSADKQFIDICAQAHRAVAAGEPLSQALRDTGAFPNHVMGTIAAGEESGRTEEVLRGLALYYNEEARLFSKVRQSISYPAILFCIMAVIIAFTVSVVLPVFADVYEGFAGSITAGSFSTLNVSLIVGWVALVITAVCALCCIAGTLLARTENGRMRLIRIFEGIPLTRKAMYQLALSRFSAAFSTYLSAGTTVDNSMELSLELVDHKRLRNKLQKAWADMVSPEHPLSLQQAIFKNKVFETAYSRMLTIGAVSGNLVEVLSSLSDIFFDDAVNQIDRAIDNIEPIMAAFLTVAVGATLIAVMLPLIGIMSSLG